MATVILSSPYKPDRAILVPAPPTMNAIRQVMSAAPELDRSWDVGELHHTSVGYTATRPRPEDRPEARKILLGHYMDEAAHHRDLVERIFKAELRRVTDEGMAEHRQHIEQLTGRFDREHREVVDETRAEHRQHIEQLTGRFDRERREVVYEARAEHEQHIEQLTGRFDRERREVVDEARAEHQQHIEQLTERLDREHREVVKEVRAEHLADSIRVQRSIVSIQDRLVHHTERTVVFNDITEGYEVVTRSLQGLNDIIFDVERQARHPGDVLLTTTEKESLKSHGLGYLSRLLDPPQNLPGDVDALRLKALNILSSQQQYLCRVLLDVQGSDGRRNFLHHPRPDCDTAMDRVADFLDDEAQNTLRDFLATDPKRLPSRRERADPDLFLFAEQGEYTNVAAQKVDLENLRAERADTEAYLEALEQEAA